MKKMDWYGVKAEYTLPYKIMDLERELVKKLKEVKDIRLKLQRLKKKFSSHKASKA